jgi:F0F1-type ATP synthase assembly protein I
MSEKKKSRRLLQVAAVALLVFAVAIHLWVSAQFGMWLVITVIGLLILHIPVAMFIRRSVRRRRAAAAAPPGR